MLSSLAAVVRLAHILAVAVALPPALTLALAACGPPLRPPPLDAGRRTDRPAPRDLTPARVDTDRDGLCDTTEASRRTDRTLADTDGDGLIDSFEILLGTNPLTITDPRPEERLALLDNPGGMATTEQFLDYRAENGEVLTASFQDRALGLDGRAASAMDLRVEAIDADPPTLVRNVQGATFEGVQGRVRLHWRVTARATPPVLRCRHAYEFLFVVKREGERVVFARSLILDLLPADGPAGPDAGPPWPHVDPDGLCLPNPPCI